MVLDGTGMNYFLNQNQINHFITSTRQQISVWMNLYCLYICPPCLQRRCISKNTNKNRLEIEIEKNICRNWRQSADGFFSQQKTQKNTFVFWMSPPLRELGHRWPCPPKVGGRGLRRLVFVGDLVHLWCKHLWYLSIYSIHLSTHIYSMYHISSLPPYCLSWQKKAGKLSATCPYENSKALNISSAANQVAVTKWSFSAGLWSREITGGY